MGKTYRKSKKYFDDDYNLDSEFKTVEGKNKNRKKKAKQIRQDRRNSDQRKYSEMVYE